MGLFDVLNFGSAEALAVKPNFQQSFQNDLNNEKMINDEISRIESDTKSAADRMKRTQLTTGKGVNAKLQAYYDTLTEQMKSTISKNPNYKTDPYQMQQVNSVMDQFSSNDIIANDLRSKVSYGQYKEQATKGVLTARQIAEADQKWKRYQDGVDDVFDYIDTKKVDYTTAVMQAVKGVSVLEKVRGLKIGASPKRIEAAIEQHAMSNPEYLDQMLVDFKTTTSLDERAKWLGIAHKDHMTPEEEVELEKDCSERIELLSKNNGLKNPIKKWIADKAYGFSNEQDNHLAIMQKQMQMYEARANAKAKTPKDNTPYYENEVGNTLLKAREVAQGRPGKNTVLGVKLSATNAFFETNAAGLPVSNRMFVKTKGSYSIPIPAAAIGYMDGSNTTKRTKMADGSIIVTNRNGVMNERLSVSSYGFVHKEDYGNMLNAIGFDVYPNGNNTVIKHGNKKIAEIQGKPSEAIEAFIIEHLGGLRHKKGAAGVMQQAFPFEGIDFPYNLETTQGLTDDNLRQNYNKEVVNTRKKYQLSEDALIMQGSGGYSAPNATDQGGFSGIPSN